MNTERRKHPRFTLDQMIELGFERERFVQAEGVNASESGILCRTYEQFEKYAKVFLMLSVPFAGKIVSVQCEGIVIRSDRAGESWETGIDITDISSEGREALRAYLNAGGGACVS